MKKAAAIVLKLAKTTLWVLFFTLVCVGSFLCYLGKRYK